MCTVTLVPLENNNFVLMSNRDEAPSRVSLNPDFYKYKSQLLLYPKDVESEGTWIGLSDKNRLICLLNGGFEIHQRSEEYRHSRGLVVKDLLIATSLDNAIKRYDLNNIEPFTLVIVEWVEELRFFEFVWDGNRKHLRSLPLESKIWSSSTLYNSRMRIERNEWFDSFKRINILNSKTLLDFHKNTNAKNKDYGVLMDRGHVKTISITGVVKDGKKIEMQHYDLNNNTQNVKLFRDTLLVNG